MYLIIKILKNLLTTSLSKSDNIQIFVIKVGIDEMFIGVGQYYLSIIFFLIIKSWCCCITFIMFEYNFNPSFINFYVKISDMNYY